MQMIPSVNNIIVGLLIENTLITQPGLGKHLITSLIFMTTAFTLVGLVYVRLIRGFFFFKLTLYSNLN